MAFADVEKLRKRLGFTFDADDEQRATELLEEATAAIIDELEGQKVEAATATTEVIDGDGRKKVLVSQIPVTNVTTVRELDSDDEWETLTADDDYRWSESGVITRVDGSCFPDKPRSVEVTYDHGYTTVPDGIQRVCVSYAARMFVNPEGSQQRRRGDASTSFASSANEASGLTDNEKRALDRFRSGR